MAISQAAGTEIVRTHMFESIRNVETTLIIGEQHHIYTVLSIVICCVAGTGTGLLKLKGWDCLEGSTAQDIYVVQTNLVDNETFVFNDKFSFAGFEPDTNDISGILNTSAEQTALAAQGGSAVQSMNYVCAGSSQYHDVTVTFIDQNNS